MTSEAGLPIQIEFNGFSPVLDLRPLDEIIISAVGKARIIENNNDIPGRMESSDLLTKQAHFYPILLKRTLELAFPLADPRETSEHFLEILEHENDHAAAALMLNFEVFYGVQIRKTIQPDGTKLPAVWGAIVYQRPDGSSSTQEELEFITSAPKKLSIRDIMKLGDLATKAP